MPSGVVTVGKRAYASGLYWENSPGSGVAQAAREALSQPGQESDLFVVRPSRGEDRVSQFGLGVSFSGHRSGMPVLAACLANKQTGSWAGAFRLREGVAVVVVRDDLIVPDGDQFFVDENEARDRLLQEMALGGLQRVYAPEIWAMPGADSMPLSLLLDEEVGFKLRAPSLSKKQRMIVLGGLVGVVVIGIAVWAIRAEMARRDAELAEALRLRNVAQVVGVVPKRPEYPPPDRKWEKRPPALAVLETCRAALDRLPLVSGTWKMQPFSCDGSAISVSWNRVKGFDSPPMNAIVDASGLNANLTIQLPVLTPRGDEQLDDQNVVTLRYLRQDWPGRIERTADDPPPPPPPGYNGEWNPPPAPWVKRLFVLTVPALPWEVPQLLSGIKGLIINNIRISDISSSATWTIEGVIYEKRP